MPPTCVCSPRGTLFEEEEECRLFFLGCLITEEAKWHEGEMLTVSALTDVNTRLAQPWGWRVNLMLYFVSVEIACGDALGLALEQAHPRSRAGLQNGMKQCPPFLVKEELFWLNAVCLSMFSRNDL